MLRSAQYAVHYYCITLQCSVKTQSGYSYLLLQKQLLVLSQPCVLYVQEQLLILHIIQLALMDSIT
jgi:hypothetical protein